jgi:hypothetical protein
LSRREKVESACQIIVLVRSAAETIQTSNVRFPHHEKNNDVDAVYDDSAFRLYASVCRHLEQPKSGHSSRQAEV